jgi:hypothetical protein
MFRDAGGQLRQIGYNVGIILIGAVVPTMKYMDLVSNRNFLSPSVISHFNVWQGNL